jgi:hypothetical protein
MRAENTLLISLAEALDRLSDLVDVDYVDSDPDEWGGCVHGLSNRPLNVQWSGARHRTWTCSGLLIGIAESCSSHR